MAGEDDILEQLLSHSARCSRWFCLPSAADQDRSTTIALRHRQAQAGQRSGGEGRRLEVEVKAGVVTLKGAVEFEQKDSAEKIAKKMTGVKSVVNSITVRAPGLRSEAALLAILTGRRWLRRRISRKISIEKVAAGFQFTEGPVWSREGFLLFSDVPDNQILQDGARRAVRVISRRTPHGANGNTFDAQGRLYSCESRDPPRGAHGQEGQDRSAGRASGKASG